MDEFQYNVRTVRRDVNGGVFPILWAIVLVVAVVTVFGYLWIDGINEKLAASIKKSEVDKQKLVLRVSNEESKWACMTSPENIRRLLVRHNLNMELRKSGVVRLKISPPGPGTAYAGGDLENRRD